MVNAIVSPIDTTPNVLFTCPLASTASARLLISNNDPASRQTVTIQWTNASSSTTYYAAYNIPIDPLTAEEFDVPLVLEENDSITITAGNGNTITVFASIEVKSNI